MRAEDRKPSKRVFPLLQNLDLENVVFQNIAKVGNPISIQDMNEQEMFALNRSGRVSSKPGEAVTSSTQSSRITIGTGTPIQCGSWHFRHSVALTDNTSNPPGTITI